VPTAWPRPSCKPVQGRLCHARPAAAELGDVQRLLQLAADSALVAEEGSPKVAKAAQSRRRGVMLYAMSSLCVSSMVGIAKMLEHGTGTHPVGKDGVPVLQIVLVRSLVVAGLGLAILGRDRTSPLGQPPCQPLLVLRGLLGSAAVISLFFAAVILPLAEALVLTFVMPLWGSLFGWLFLGEPLQKALLAVFPVCLAGILLLAKPWEDPRSASGTAKGAEAFPHRHLGVAVAVFHAATSAGAKTCVRALGKGGQHPQVIVMYLSIAVLGCSAVGLFGIQDSAVSARPWQWLAMVVAGFCGFGSQTFSTLALRSISVGEGAVVNYLTLVWGELYGVLIFHELPSASSAAGAALVATCTLVLLQQRG